MRILLAGAAGFIGSNLTDRLLAEGHEIIGLDNYITGRPGNLAHLQGQAGFTLRVGDAISPVDVEGALDWVLHFASPASPPKYLGSPVETMRVNSEGTFQLLELARLKGARFLLASTSEVYGDPLSHPQSEAYWGNVNPVGPRSVYDEGKRYAEALTIAYHSAYGLSTRIVRIFNTYGPRMDPDDGRVVSNFLVQALRGEPLTIYGDGTQTRSFQYVDDLIDGVMRLMGVEYHGPVNLGNPEEYTMLQLAELILEMTGSESRIVFLPLPEDDPKKRRPDISLARELLDWEPTVPVCDGLQQTKVYFESLS